MIVIKFSSSVSIDAERVFNTTWKVSFEWRKTNTTTLANPHWRRQSNEPITTQSKYTPPTQSAGKRVTFRFYRDSDWLRITSETFFLCQSTSALLAKPLRWRTYPAFDTDRNCVSDKISRLQLRMNLTGLTSVFRRGCPFPDKAHLWRTHNPIPSESFVQLWIRNKTQKEKEKGFKYVWQRKARKVKKSRAWESQEMREEEIGKTWGVGNASIWNSIGTLLHSTEKYIHVKKNKLGLDFYDSIKENQPTVNRTKKIIH